MAIIGTALPLNVYRTSKFGDCTNGGISAYYDELLLLCDDGFIKIDFDNPPKNVVQLVCREFGGRKIYHIEPIVEPSGAGWMMGGNYAATSDSRFSKMMGGFYGAIPIHDRQETWEQYDRLSR